MLKPHPIEAYSLEATTLWGLSLKYLQGFNGSQGFNGFKVFMSFLYIFYKMFKSQYSMVLMNCAFVRFCCRFISFVLGLGLQLECTYMTIQ